jgi:hypothetical protein
MTQKIHLVYYNGKKHFLKIVSLCQNKTQRNEFAANRNGLQRRTKILHIEKPHNVCFSLNSFKLS